MGPNFTQTDAVDDELQSDIGASLWIRRMSSESRFFPQFTFDYLKFGSTARMESYLLGMGYRLLDTDLFNHDVVLGVGAGHALNFPQATPDQTRLAGQFRYNLEYQWKPDLLLGFAFELVAVDLDDKRAKDAQTGIPMVFLAWQPSEKKTSTPEPPKHIEIPENKDIDGDGVVNKKDRCPDTPAGAKVNNFGCVPKERIEMQIVINFDTDSDVIPQSDDKELAELALVLKENPKATLTIEGHTDSTGRLAYNMGLSSRRAASVRKHLIERHQIATKRIRSKGYGPTRPVADNATAEGRQKNRRVLAVFQDHESEK